MKSGVLPYMPQLDALRTIAIGSVLVAHFFPYKIGEFIPFGSLGVRLFFVLSGFLITGILLRCKELVTDGTAGVGFVLEQFYIRRTLRIFPIYYATLAVAAILGFSNIRATWLYHFGYMTNVCYAFRTTQLGVISHYWSLAVEEQFYWIWPTLILLVPPQKLIKTIVTLIIIAPLFRWGCVWSFGPDKERLLVACFDSLGVGALLAVVFRNINRDSPAWVQWNRWGGWLTGGAFVTIQALRATQTVPAFSVILGDTIDAMFFAWLISRSASGFTGWLGKLLCFPPMVYLGKISYGIYVYHMFVIFAVPRIFRLAGIPYPDAGIRFVILTSLSILLAMVSWHLLESPINNLRAHFNYKK